MKINKILYIGVCLTLCAGTVTAQKAEREYLRKGNRSFRKQAYVESEVSYRKALDVNSFSSEALYNLGNSMALQGKNKEALELYQKAAEKSMDNPRKQSMIYHNIGDLHMAATDYASAIEAFKQSLRKDPTNDQTRYNLVLAQKLLKKNPPQNQDQQQKEQEKKDQNQEQDQKKDQKDQNSPKEEEQKKDEMSKENAEQLLKAAMQDEQRLREKMKQQAPAQGNQLEKDW